jgi:hypothetical protein
MTRTLGVLAALLAILLWTFGNTIVELESYRYANSLGMCHVTGVDYAADAQARAQREECLERADTQKSPIWHLLHALRIVS